MRSSSPAGAQRRVSRARAQRAAIGTRAGGRTYRDRERRPYVHLVDGGLIDNLGVRAPIDFAIERGGFFELADAVGYKDLIAAVFVSVNAERDPDLAADKSANVPSLLQLAKTLELPVKAHSFETMDQLHSSFASWREQLRKRRERDAPEFYFIDVSLRSIADEHERNFFMHIPTTLHLPDATVDRLRSVARRLFLDSPDLKRLQRDLSRPSAQDASPPSTQNAACMTGPPSERSEACRR